MPNHFFSLFRLTKPSRKRGRGMLKKLLRGDCSFIKIHIAVKGRQKEEHLRFCNTEIIWLDPDKLKRTAQAKD